MSVPVLLAVANGAVGMDCFPCCGDPCAEVAILSSFAGSFVVGLICTADFGLASTAGCVGALAALVHTAVHYILKNYVFPTFGLDKDGIPAMVIETVTVIAITQGLLFLAAPIVGTAIQIDLVFSLVLTAAMGIWMYIKTDHDDDILVPNY